MKIIGVIPARMGSSRFPGKPLAEICGMPMIGHVYKNCKESKKLDEVYIATCDKEIEEYAFSINAKVIMTSPSHERASDRTMEAMLTVEEATGKKTDIVVMIQGDEPMVQSGMIDQAVAPLVENENILVSNLMAEIKTLEEQDDPNEVKVVVDKDDFALYFSRESVPSRKKGAKEIKVLKQVCIIPFKRDFLIKFGELETHPLEIIESVDMLRVLENGYKVKMVMTDFETYSVDTREDLEKVESILMDK